MSKIYKFLLLIGMVIFVIKPLSGQVDSSETAMKFDLGITRDQNINLWPLFKISHETNKNELQILFPVYTKRTNLPDSSIKSHLLPIFCNYKDSTISDKRIGSIYYPSILRIKNDKAREIKSVAVLQLAPKIQMLEFAKSKDGLFVENNLLFFLWSKNDVENQSSHLICFPLYWSFTEKDRKFNSLMPLYLYGSYNNRQNNYLAITPLYWHFNQGKTNTNLLFPIYYSKKDSIQNTKVLFPLAWKFENEKYKSFTFLPFYSKGYSQGNEREYLMASPVYWQFSSLQAKNRLLFPIYFDRKSYHYNDTTVLKTVFPLYWSYSDNNSKHKIVFPLFWSLKNENFKSLTILPFYSGGHSTDQTKKHLMLASVYWQFDRPEGSKRAILPLYWSSKHYYENDTSVFKALFPIYWSNRDNTVDNKVVFPISWSFKNSNYKSYTFFPLYSKGQSFINSSEYHMYSMIYWQFNSNNQVTKTLLPVYWSQTKYDDHDTSTFKTIFPVYWSYRDNEKNIKLFAPLAWSSKNSAYKSFTILPIYSGGHSTDQTKKHLMLASVYWQFDRPEGSKKAILPIYWSSKNYYKNDTSVFKTLFPIYWANKNNSKDNKVVFPLSWSFKNEDYKSYTLFPFYSKGISFNNGLDYKMFSMIYWKFETHNQSFKSLFPVYWSYKKYNRTDTTIFRSIFPIYWANKNNSADNKVVFPISWSFKNQHFQSYTFIPIYSKGHSIKNDNKHLMVSMVYWKFESNDHQTNILFPFYWSQKQFYDGDTLSTKTVFPFYWEKKDWSSSHKVVFPIAWNFKNKYYESFTLFPLYSKGHSPDSSNTHRMYSMLYWQFNSEDSKFRTLFPVYFSKKKYENQDTSSFKTIFPVYWSYQDNEKNIKLFAPLAWSSKSRAYKSFTFLPIYSSGHSTYQKQKHLMLASLYWQFDKPESSKKAILPIYWSSKNYYENDTSIFKTLFPIYWANKNNSRDNKVVFPISWSLKNSNYKSYTFFPLYSKGISFNNGLEYKMFSMLYWQFDSQDSKFRTFFPVYYSKKKITESDTSTLKVLFPVYYANKDNFKDNKVVFPLSWSLKNENYKSYTFFPLYSKGSSPEKDKKHAMFSLLYWQFETKNQTSKTFIPIFNSTKKYYENDTVETKAIIPFYLAKQSNSVDNKIVFPLVWSLKNEDYKSFTFLPFYSKGSNTDNKNYMAITPLFWKFESKDDTRNILFPIYSNYKNTKGDEKSNVLLFVMRHNQIGQRNSNQFLWPICESTKDSGYRYFRFAPVIWYKKTEDSKFFSIQPLYYTSENKEFESHNVLWQLYASKNQYGYKKSKTILWKLFYKDTYENNDYETRFLYLAYANVKKEGKTEKSYFPFCYKSSDDEGNKSFAAFFYFYNKFQRRIGESNDFYKEEKIFWFIRLRSNYKALKREGKIDKRVYFG